MKAEALFQYPLDENSTLQEALDTLDVAELQGIMFYMYLQETPIVQREVLIEKITAELPQRVKRFVQCFDMERYTLFQAILEKNGILSPVCLEMPKILTLMEMGLAYPAIRYEQQVLVIPREIREVLLELSAEQWKAEAASNTKLLQKIYGLLYYYGYLDTVELFRHCFHKEPDDVLENVHFMELLYAAVLYYGEIEPEESGFRHKFFLYSHHVRTQQKKIQDVLTYKPFPDCVLERAGQPNYMEWTLDMQRLKKFLTCEGKMSEALAKREVEAIWYDFNNGFSLTDVCDYFSECYFFNSTEQLQEELAYHILKMFYTMPQWLLKGYSFAEIARQGGIEC